MFFVHKGHANFDFNDPQYLKYVVFFIEKSSDGQNHSSSDTHHLIKKSLSKISHSYPTGGYISTLPVNAIWETLLRRRESNLGFDLFYFTFLM